MNIFTLRCKQKLLISLDFELIIWNSKIDYKAASKWHHRHSFNLTCLPTCLASKHRRKFSSCYAAKWRWVKRRCCTILQLKSARRYFMALIRQCRFSNSTQFVFTSWKIVSSSSPSTRVKHFSLRSVWENWDIQSRRGQMIWSPSKNRNGPLLFTEFLRLWRGTQSKSSSQ